MGIAYSSIDLASLGLAIAHREPSQAAITLTVEDDCSEAVLPVPQLLQS